MGPKTEALAFAWLGDRLAAVVAIELSPGEGGPCEQPHPIAWTASHGRRCLSCHPARQRVSDFIPAAPQRRNSSFHFNVERFRPCRESRLRPLMEKDLDFCILQLKAPSYMPAKAASESLFTALPSLHSGRFRLIRADAAFLPTTPRSSDRAACPTHSARPHGAAR